MYIRIYLINHANLSINKYKNDQRTQSEISDSVHAVSKSHYADGLLSHQQVLKRTLRTNNYLWWDYLNLKKREKSRHNNTFSNIFCLLQTLVTYIHPYIKTRL